MDKRFWIIIGAIAALFVGILWFNSHKHSSTATSTNTTAAPTEHITGNTTSKVKLVEYGDFQCPYCGQYYPIVQQVEQKYQDKVAFQFRNYPLIQVHKNALSSARAAEAASNQGKFWDMYNLLYSNQSAWSGADNALTIFQGYASQLGLDTAKFNTDFASQVTNNTINADIAAFNSLGLEKATPTYILNGKQIKPAATVDDFSKYIDEALKTAQ
jgi:protein-disulfide isomerase